MQPAPGTPGTAVDVIINDNGQSLIFRDANWGLRPPRTLRLKQARDYSVVSDDNGFVGFVSAEAASKLAGCSGHFLGELANGSMVAVGRTRVEFLPT